jgi:glycosyltransferase involved in cell wall biosynthesis
MALPDELGREVLANAGIDTHRPLVVQVSRFDPWKDPMGVIEAYRIARRDVPGLQLALVGAIAGDDPEGWQLLALVNKETADDDDIFVFTNLAGVGSMEVNAFQRAGDLVIQKSLREGFGLALRGFYGRDHSLVRRCRQSTARRSGRCVHAAPNLLKKYEALHGEELILEDEGETRLQTTAALGSPWLPACLNDGTCSKEQVH